VTPGTYERKTFLVQAVQVTADNMQDVADWCGGEIVPTPPRYKRQGSPATAVKVPISVPSSIVFNERHSLGLAGDWVVNGAFGAKGTQGFKVYQPTAFAAGFEPRDVEQKTTDAQELKALFEAIEPPCGKIEYTLDHQPCVLGKGHLDGTRKVGCRSLRDYLYA
jgi:hypothetical protein